MAHPDFDVLTVSWELALRADGYAANTVTAYQNAVRSLAGWLAEHHPDVGPAELERQHIRGWLVEVRDRHAFRHTWAHAFRAAGGNEGDLMLLGGWRSRAMLDRYGKAATADRAADAYGRLSPGDRIQRRPVQRPRRTRIASALSPGDPTIWCICGCPRLSSGSRASSRSRACLTSRGRAWPP